MNNTEIERKFLVVNDSYKQLATHSYRIAQGYLSKDPQRVVRIRIRDEEAFLTIKAIGETAATHFEYETPIDIASAQQLLTHCLPGIIEKTRYIIPVGNNLKWEVDVFHADNEGLIIAEIELPSEDSPFDRLSFVGKEVTQDSRYYNAALSEHPMPQRELQ